MLVPWGDVASAYHSTGVPTIEVYFRAPAALRWGNALGGLVRPLLGTAPVQRFLNDRVARQPAGPDERERALATHVIVAEARDRSGGLAISRMRTPNGYSLTEESCLEVARRVLAGTCEPGFSTPAKLLGPDFALELEGVTREDVA